MVIEYAFGKRTLAGAAGEPDDTHRTEPQPSHGAAPRRARQHARPSQLEVVEPATDVFDEPKEIVLLFELPGAREADIRCVLDGDILLLEAKTEVRLYRKEVLIEAKLRPDAPRRRLQNGVLEVRLAKQA